MSLSGAEGAQPSGWEGPTWFKGSSVGPKAITPSPEPSPGQDTTQGIARTASQGLKTRQTLGPNMARERRALTETRDAVSLG